MHDAAYKNLFSYTAMVEDLIRGFVAEKWIDALDFETLEKLSAEFVSDDLRQRRGDGVWRVRFRDEWFDEAREKGLKAGREKGIDEGRKEGRKEGIEQVRAEERALLCRLAARKFDTETAERLSGLLDRLTDPDRLAEVGEWIIECGTGADLLDRVERVVRHS